MEKFIFFIEDRNRNLGSEAFHEFIFHRVVPRVMECSPANCKLTITSPEQPVVTVLPLSKNRIAMFSVAGADPGTMQAALESFQTGNRLVYGYRVHESPYLLPARSWNCGEESPGLILLTCFRRKPDLSTPQFMSIWFGEHSPKAILTHPLSTYIRNVVTGRITAETPLFDGIVEEHFARDADLLNPVRMFGGIRKAIPSMIGVYRHVITFLDLATIRNFICREYLLCGELAACNEEMRDDIVKVDRGGILAAP